jgi:predicted ribosome quality control (RQC) complex YloA/Tae2 family protein
VQQVQRWKARTLKPKEEYRYPDPTTNTLELNEKEFEELRKTTNKESIVKFLATELSLGGFYAEEVCHLAGIEKNQKSIESRGVYQAVKKLLRKKIKPSLYEKEVLPFESERLENAKRYETFNQAIQAKLSNTIDTKEKKQLTQYKQKLDSIKRIIKEQENAIKKLRKQISDNTAKAELIYNKYQEVSSFLEKLKELRSKGKLADAKEHKIVKEINQKEKYVIIEI